MQTPLDQNIPTPSSAPPRATSRRRSGSVLGSYRKRRKIALTYEPPSVEFSRNRSQDISPENQTLMLSQSLEGDDCVVNQSWNLSQFEDLPWSQDPIPEFKSEVSISPLESSNSSGVPITIENSKTGEIFEVKLQFIPGKFNYFVN